MTCRVRHSGSINFEHYSAVRATLSDYLCGHSLVSLAGDRADASLEEQGPRIQLDGVADHLCES